VSGDANQGENDADPEAKTRAGRTARREDCGEARCHPATATALAEKKAKGPKKPSLLDLAAEVLAKAGKPMGCKEIVEAVLAGGEWKTKGKTPAATLYSAIIREIAKLGQKARFRKVERGQFTAVSASK
jgi:hypothetical protein